MWTNFRDKGLQGFGIYIIFVRQSMFDYCTKKSFQFLSTISEWLPQITFAIVVDIFSSM